MVRVTGGGWFGCKIQHLSLVKIESLVVMSFARDRER
jgi:hypothetical protein